MGHCLRRSDMQGSDVLDGLDFVLPCDLLLCRKARGFADV